jgi:hypothetical protein
MACLSLADQAVPSSGLQPIRLLTEGHGDLVDERADSAVLDEGQPFRCSTTAALLLSHGDDFDGHELRFYLFCEKGPAHGDDGAFHAGQRKTYTYNFRIPPQGLCHVLLSDRTAGKKWYTPNIER